MLKNEENINKQKTRKLSNDLSNIRIIQKHLVYVIGLSSQLTNKDTLAKPEFFGQYGAITKLVVNKSKAYNPSGINGPSYSAYVSYASPLEASLAVLAVDNITYDNHTLRASFGTTKYCSFFLKKLDCSNKDCLYLHDFALEEDIITKDEMSSNKGIFSEQQLIAIKQANLSNKDIKKKLIKNSRKRSNFPTVESIFSKEIVIQSELNINQIKENLKPANLNNSNETIEENINTVNSTNKRRKSPLCEILNVESPKNSKTLKDSLDLLSSNNSTCNNTFGSCLSSSIDLNKSDNQSNYRSNAINNCLYFQRESSRFNFIHLNKDSYKESIPEFIPDYINRFAKRYTFFKTFDNVFSINKKEILLKNKYNTNHAKAKFDNNENNDIDNIKNEEAQESSINKDWYDFVNSEL